MKMLILSVHAADAPIVATVENEASVHSLRKHADLFVVDVSEFGLLKSRPTAAKDLCGFLFAKDLFALDPIGFHLLLFGVREYFFLLGRRLFDGPELGNPLEAISFIISERRTGR
jgi:hypothetical protein